MLLMTYVFIYGTIMAAMYILYIFIITLFTSHVHNLIYFIMKLLLPCDVEDIATVDAVFDKLKAEWGKPILADDVKKALAEKKYQMIFV